MNKRPIMFGSWSIEQTCGLRLKLCEHKSIFLKIHGLMPHWDFVRIMVVSNEVTSLKMRRIVVFLVRADFLYFTRLVLKDIATRALISKSVFALPSWMGLFSMLLVLLVYI